MKRTTNEVLGLCAGNADRSEHAVTTLCLLPDDGNGAYLSGNQGDFLLLRQRLAQALLDAPVVHAARWQQLDVSASDAHATYELLNVTMQLEMPPAVLAAQAQIQPDLPWAEKHFRERVGGLPINPGVEHANWPYHAQGADLHLKDIWDYTGRKARGYDHNYMERMWPTDINDGNGSTWNGYRFAVGDLGDVVEQLKHDPTTRQAYLPIWFPEDTGATSGQRVPCSLGYHFIIRNGELHCQYNLRSVEIYRHFTNDVYMAIRLAQWVADQVGDAVSQVGKLTMNMVSFHGFVGDTYYIEEMAR